MIHLSGIESRSLQSLFCSFLFLFSFMTSIFSGRRQSLESYHPVSNLNSFSQPVSHSSRQPNVTVRLPHSTIDAFRSASPESEPLLVSVQPLTNTVSQPLASQSRVARAASIPTSATVALPPVHHTENLKPLLLTSSPTISARIEPAGFQSAVLRLLQIDEWAPEAISVLPLSAQVLKLLFR